MFARLLKWAGRAWGAMSAAVLFVFGADSMQPYFSAVWLTALICAVAALVGYILSRTQPDARRELFRPLAFTTTAFVVALAFGIAQEVIPGADGGGVWRALFPDLNAQNPAPPQRTPAPLPRPPAPNPPSPDPPVKPVVDECGSKQDPRRYLACRGIAWNEDSFWTAIENRAREDVEMFVEAGWKMEGNSFLVLVSRDTYDPATAHPIVARRAVRSFDFCTGPATGMIAALTSRPRAFADFVAICGAGRLRAHYAQAVEAERARIGAESGQSRTSHIAICADRLKSELPIERAYDQAARFNIFSVDTLDERSALLAGLQKALLYNGVGERTKQSVYDAAVAKACHGDTPEPAEKTSAALADYERILRSIPPP